ncbi:MAG: cbb3-type cytochrome c oxidase subunit I, partial [Acidimicrobiales bacterium]
DVAFPRMNALGFWLFLFGGFVLNLAFFTGGAADGGWFAYAPNTGVTFSPGNGMDYWALGILLTGIASLIGAINLIVTVLNMRAPGMTLMRMPVFTWMALVVQFLLLFAIPVITVPLIMILLDRLFDANFFNVAQGSDPLLWQHLFWIFGHPEVYIIILPAFGIVSETIPVFSKKPLFGYPFIVFSGIAIGFMGWGVWAHHMFASGIGPVSVATFSLTTMFIAVPTGVKILNWMATMWGGKITFAVPMKFSIALVAMFTIGGLSGVTHAVAPSDTQQTDTYFIVAHFHYVIFGGAVLGLFGGLYFWWSKVFGYMLSERRGNWHFWLMFIGLNMTFGPMHILGLQGMPRRTYRYDANQGYDFWNQVSTIGSFIIAAGAVVFVYNIFKSRSEWKRAGKPPALADPWDGRSLEWSIPSPAPVHNFDYTPRVTQLDDFWHRKYKRGDDDQYTRAHTGEELAQRGDGEPHLPSPSYWPIVMASGFPLIALGLIYSLPLAFVGLAVVAGSMFGWGLEPATAPSAHHEVLDVSDADKESVND